MQLKLKNQKILYASYYIRHCVAGDKAMSQKGGRGSKIVKKKCDVIFEWPIIKGLELIVALMGRQVHF